MNKGLQMLLETLAPIAIKHFGITPAQVQELFNKAYPTVMQAAETVAKFEIALTAIQQQQAQMLAMLQANEEKLQHQLKEMFNVRYGKLGEPEHDINGDGIGFGDASPYVNGGIGTGSSD